MKTILSILIFLLFLLTNCKPSTQTNSAAVSKEKTIQAVAIFLVGEAFSGTNKLKVGSRISVGEQVKLGVNSTLDLQLLGTETPISFRLKQNTEFELQVNSSGELVNYSTEIKKGEGLFQVDKMRSKNENFRVVTPTSIAGVRGTKFRVGVNDKGTQTQVLEGQVAHRLRIPELEKISPVDLDKSTNLKQFDSELEKSELVLSNGELSEINIIQQDSLKKELGISSQELDSSKILELEKKLEKAKPKMPVLELKKSSADNLKDLQEEFQEIVPILPEKLQSNLEGAINERNELNKQLRKKVITRQSTRILLKNGKIVSGIITEKDGINIIETEEGVIEIPVSEVKEVLF
jgi:hypothetical protein